MSELHNTLFAVSCLAALGLGLSGGLVYCYYGHWRPTIRAHQAALDTLKTDTNTPPQEGN